MRYFLKTLYNYAQTLNSLNSIKKFKRVFKSSLRSEIKIYYDADDAAREEKQESDKKCFQPTWEKFNAALSFSCIFS